MRFVIATTLSLAALAAAIPQVIEPTPRWPIPCGPRYPECPSPLGCTPESGAVCADRPSCGGICDYKPCGGMLYPARECGKGEVCIDDPRLGGCGMACDRPGICVSKESKPCGGFVGARCEDERQKCYDFPGDGCDPENGGRDCAGICLFPVPKWGPTPTPF